MVKMPTDVFDVSSFRAQLDGTQFALEQFAVDFVDVVLMLSESILIRSRKVALITCIRFRC